MTAAEAAAYRALLGALEPLVAILDNQQMTAYAVVANPGLVNEQEIKQQFEAINVRSGVEAGQGDSHGPQYKVLGSIPPPLQSLFALNCMVASLLATAHEAYQVFQSEHQQRHTESVPSNSKSTGSGGGKPDHEEALPDEGCLALMGVSNTIARFVEILKGRQGVFWALVKDLHPGASKVRVTPDRNFVETTSTEGRFEKLIEAMLGSFILEELGSDGDDESGAGDLFGGLEDFPEWLETRRERRSSQGGDPASN